MYILFKDCTVYCSKNLSSVYAAICFIEFINKHVSLPYPVQSRMLRFKMIGCNTFFLNPVSIFSQDCCLSKDCNDLINPPITLFRHPENVHIYFMFKLYFEVFEQSKDSTTL